MKIKGWQLGAWILAAVFCFSAAAKLAGLGAFELLLAREGLVTSRPAAAVLARFLIAGELTLGLGLWQRAWLRRVLLPATGVLLSGFTLYLAHAAFIRGSTDNCGCFGELIVMSPAQAIVKNLVMLVVAAWVWLRAGPDPQRPWWPLAVLAAGTITFCFVAFPPRTIRVQEPGQPPPDRSSPFARFSEFSQGTVDLRRGTALVAFLSLDCEHCQQLAQDLVALNVEHPLPPVYMVFLGEVDQLPGFLELTEAPYPYLLADPVVFFDFIGTAPPRLYLLRDGQPQAVWDRTDQPVADLKQRFP